MGGMSASLVHYVPIVTTILAVPFALEIFRRYREHPERLHLLWWAIGIATYGVGTFTEATTTLIGWNEQMSRFRRSRMSCQGTSESRAAVSASMCREASPMTSGFRTTASTVFRSAAKDSTEWEAV